MTVVSRPPGGAAPSRFAGWTRTTAWYRVPGVTVLAVGIGLATGRPDVVTLAAPLLLGWVAALIATRHLLGARTPRATVAVDEASFGSNSAEVTTELTGMDGVEFVSVAQPGTDAGALGATVPLPGGRGGAEVRPRFRTRRWGVTAVARPDLLGAGPDGLYLTGPVRRGTTRTELVLPEVVGIAPLTLPPILGGWAGAHVSRRPGQGSDLVDLREFAPGDRLRSIHWRAYARHERMDTRRTLSDADAEVMICLDLSAILQPRPPRPPSGWPAVLAHQVRTTLREMADSIAERRGDDGPQRRRETEQRLRASSLDHAVAAAAAIAAAHLGQGDRVGLLTASIPRRIVRPGAGNRQLQRIRHQLALLEDRRYRMIDVALWGLRPGQIVVLCSPMVSPTAVRAALDCASRGHRVIVVDTLPLTGMLSRATVRDADHLRILTIERELQLDGLRGRGIPVLSWDAGDISLQMVTAQRVLRSRR